MALRDLPGSGMLVYTRFPAYQSSDTGDKTDPCHINPDVSHTDSPSPEEAAAAFPRIPHPSLCLRIHDGTEKDHSLPHYNIPLHKFYSTDPHH